MCVAPNLLCSFGSIIAHVSATKDTTDDDVDGDEKYQIGRSMQRFRNVHKHIHKWSAEKPVNGHLSQELCHAQHTRAVSVLNRWKYMNKAAFRWTRAMGIRPIVNCCEGTAKVQWRNSYQITHTLTSHVHTEPIDKGTNETKWNTKQHQCLLWTIQRKTLCHTDGICSANCFLTYLNYQYNTQDNLHDIVDDECVLQFKRFSILHIFGAGIYAKV